MVVLSWESFCCVCTIPYETMKGNAAVVMGAWYEMHFKKNEELKLGSTNESEKGSREGRKGVIRNYELKARKSLEKSKLLTAKVSCLDY